MNIFRENKGFTLIEVLMAAALTGMVVTLASGMFIQLFDVFNTGQHRINVGQRAELGKSTAARIMRRAVEIDHEIVDNKYKEIVSGQRDVFFSTAVSGAEFEITDDINNNLILYYDGQKRSIAEAVELFRIEALDYDNSYFKIIIEYRIEKNTDQPGTRKKSITISPKNI